MNQNRPKAARNRDPSSFEVCAHTCVSSPCISKSTNTILWKSNGNSVRRHATKWSLHLRCNTSCPCYPYMDTKSSQMCARRPTMEELRFIDNIVEDDEEMEDDHMDDRTYTAPHDPIIDPSSGSHQRRPLRIMYVPDPTLAVSTPSAAKNDLAFIHASLTSRECESICHLQGSVHMNGYKAILQEWVRIKYTMLRILLTDYSSAVYGHPDGPLERRRVPRKMLRNTLSGLARFRRHDSQSEYTTGTMAGAVFHGLHNRRIGYGHAIHVSVSSVEDDCYLTMFPMQW